MNLDERIERLAKANIFIQSMARHGRKFFRHKDSVSWLEMDVRGRIWFFDSYTRKRIYTHYRGRWKHFTGGGTLKMLIEALRTYVMTGKKLSRRALWWPDWYCGGDLWGYGKEEMEPVRHVATTLGLVERSLGEGVQGRVGSSHGEFDDDQKREGSPPRSDVDG